jgi:methyl-accepting chemotaxis protein
MLFNRKPKETLREMAAEFIFENSPDAYSVLDGGAISECNAALEEFMGLPRDKLIGITSDCLSPERQPDGRNSIEAAAVHINTALSTGRTRFEWVHQRLDGTPLPVEVTLLRAELDGRPVLIVFWHDMRDTEKLRRAEKAAQDQVVEVARQQKTVLDSLAVALTGLAKGDLTTRLTQEVAAAYQGLKDDFNNAMDALQNALTSVAGGAQAVQTGAAEITQASDDLSRRTEQQASNLEETAAALDEITATVRKAAQSTTEARNVVTTAKANAERSGAVVRETVAAMGEIEKSSKQINNIIGVIDEIAFQTNLLALNAGVEAARAGDAGRGFAVVATEVRALAQRSADAAKEIKTLIAASGAQVESGVKLVNETGKALGQIVEEVNRLNALVMDIAGSAQEQATALNQVNGAVNQMDQVTQQNAAMVEESAAASHGMAGDAQELYRLIGQFRLGETPMHKSAAPAQSAAQIRDSAVSGQRDRRSAA